MSKYPIPEDLKQRYDNLASYKPMEVAVTNIYVRDWLVLIERIARLEAQVESTNTLLRAATNFERALIDALGPYHPSRSIAEDVRALVATVAVLQGQLKERTENADFLRSMVGACHLMISRNDLEELQRQEWEATTLPPRLHRFIAALVAKCERLEAPVSDDDLDVFDGATYGCGEMGRHDISRGLHHVIAARVKDGKIEGSGVDAPDKPRR